MDSFVSIGSKLIFLVLVISITSIAVTTGLAYNFADTIIKGNIKESLKDESETRGQTITSIIESRLDKLQTFAQNNVLLETFDEVSASLDDVTFNTLLEEKIPLIDREVHSFQLNHLEAGLRDLQIINMRAKPIFSLNEQIDPFTYVQGRYIVDKPTVEFIQDDAQNRLMKISLPIFSVNERQVGVLVATMGSSVFDDVLLNRFGLHETGEVYLVNKDRMMVSESLFVKDARFNQQVDTFAVSECFDHNRSVQAAEYADYRGVDIFGYSYCNRDLGFVLLTEVDESAILKPISELQNSILVVGLILMIVATAITFVLSKRISSPILKLRDAAQKLSSGNFDVRTNIKTGDEIEQLSASFDNMAKTLQETISAIGKRENIIRQQEDILLKFFEEKQDSYVCLVDLVGSARLTESLDLNAKKQYSKIFTDAIVPVIKKHHGISIKVIDDAILFYFPTLENNDAIKNMLNCCLEISQLDAALNAKTTSENLPGMAYRISSAYGTINVAKTSDSLIQDIFGEPVNTCFKINQYALPNTVVVDKSVYEKAKDLDFKFTKIDQSIVKNLEYDIFIVSK